MGRWVAYSDYNAQYPGLTEAEFDDAALLAERVINRCTSWKAEQASDDGSLSALNDCETQLIRLIVKQQSQGQSGTDGVLASASNDGYSETYVSGVEFVQLQTAAQVQLVRDMLGGPEARWMLYRGVR